MTEEVTLFPYQDEGSLWLANKKFALLADEMGLGKTVQAIRGLDRIRARTAVVICPSVAKINWSREFEMWEREKRDLFIANKLSDRPKPGQTLICSFDYVTENFRDLILNYPKWDALIVDEAHFLKGLDTKRTMSVMGKNGLSRHASRVWLLSGTPAPNNAGELWVMLYTFGVTKLSYSAFINRYCHVRQTKFGLQVSTARKENLNELRGLLSQIMLRRLKKDIMKQLPPLTYSYTYVEAGKVDLEILPTFSHYFIPEDKTDKLREDLKKQARLCYEVLENVSGGFDNKLRVLQGIAHSISTLRRYLGLQKCDAVIELLKRELEENPDRQIVIFAIHRDVIETLKQGLWDFRPHTLYGNTPREKRQKHIDNFQKGKCRVFIGNIAAAGTAITLTAAHHVVFVEQSWTPGENAQAVMRVHRIGQEHPVSVRFVLLAGSLDDRVGHILKKKTSDLTAILD